MPENPESLGEADPTANSDLSLSRARPSSHSSPVLHCNGEAAPFRL